MTAANTTNIPPEKLVRVTFQPEGKTVEFEYGTLPYDHHGKPMSFLDVAENFNIFLDHACGGSCDCTHAQCDTTRKGSHVRHNAARNGRPRKATPYLQAT